MKQVYETNDEVELQMLIGLLESNGIYTQIYTDGAGDYLRIKGSDFMIPKGVLCKRQRLERSIRDNQCKRLWKKEKGKKRQNANLGSKNSFSIIFSCYIRKHNL